MATSYTVTFSSAVKASAPAIFDTNQAQNPTGATCTGIGQEVGKADGATVTAAHIGGAAANLRVDTDGNPNTP